MITQFIDAFHQVSGGDTFSQQSAILAGLSEKTNFYNAQLQCVVQ